MNRKKYLIVILALVLCVGIASAALLPYFGRIQTEIDVAQSLLVDGKDYTVPIEETLSGVAGDLIVGEDTHWLTNNADNTIVVKMVSTLTSHPNCKEGLEDVYPEYKLDAWIEDDGIRLDLASAITWTDFMGISFNYFIEADTWDTLNDDPYPELTGPWIPQINIRLLDSEGNVVYGVAWHSFRNGITGTVGMQESITYFKNDFYIYNSKFDVMPTASCLWSDAGDELKAAMNLLTFSVFSQQAGDTSVDPNDPTMTQTYGDYWPAKSQQIVWVGNHDMDVKGIQVRSSVGATGQSAEWAHVEFRMAYKFKVDAVPGLYTVETEIVLAS